MDTDNDRLLMVVKEAWLLLDASELISSLDPSFVYVMPAVVNKKVPYSEYPNYITDKFRLLEGKGVSISAKIEPDGDRGRNRVRLCGKWPNGDSDEELIRIRTNSGRIVELSMDYN